MEHPDEGTIHAWLDDVLPHDEASALESHVQHCSACAAAVAEARGYIAASSRILSALDAVPAQVLPAAGAAASSLDDLRRVQARRQRVVRQVLAVAATAAFAVTGGIYMLGQGDNGIRGFADTAALDQRIAEAVALDSGVVRAATESQRANATETRGANAAESGQGSAAAGVGATAAIGSEQPGGSGAAAQTTVRGSRVPTAPQVTAASPNAALPVAARGATSTQQAGDVAAKSVAARESGGVLSGVADSATAVRHRTMSIDSSLLGRGARADVMSTVAAVPPLPPTPPAASAGAMRGAGNALQSTGIGETMPIVNRAVTDRLAGCYALVSTVDQLAADSRGAEATVVAALPAQIRLTDSLIAVVDGSPRYLARSILAGGRPVRRFAWSTQGSATTIRLFVGDSIDAPSVVVSADSVRSSAAGRLARGVCR